MPVALNLSVLPRAPLFFWKWVNHKYKHATANKGENVLHKTRILMEVNLGQAKLKDLKSKIR